MRMQATTITLGGEAWPVRPLTVAQVQAIEPLLFASGDDKRGSVASAVAILRVALGRDHANAAARLEEVEAGAPAIAAAMAQVLRLGGFLPVDFKNSGDANLGEVGAGPVPARDRPASTGPVSSPA